MDRWVRLELRVVRSAMRNAEVLEYAIAELRDLKFSHRPLQWIWSQIELAYQGTGEFDARALAAQIKSIPKEAKHRDAAIAVFKQVHSVKPLKRPRHSIQVLKDRLKKIQAMQLLHKAVDSFKVGKDEVGFHALHTASESLKATEENGIPLAKPMFGPRWIKPKPYQGRLPTGLFWFDHLFGGPALHEVCLLIADTGGAKSYTLTVFGKNAVIRRRKVLVLDTENGEELTYARYLCSFTGIKADKIYEGKTDSEEDEILDRWHQRNHDIIADHLRVNYLGYDEHTWDAVGAAIERNIKSGFCPDLVLFDSPDHLVKDAKTYWEGFARIANGIKRIAAKYPTRIWCTSQVSANGDSQGKIWVPRDVADSKQKIKNAAMVISINQVHKKQRSEDGFEPRKRNGKVLTADQMDWVLYVGKMRGRRGYSLIPLEVDLDRAYIQAPPPGAHYAEID